jgi:hypothetical protein
VLNRSVIALAAAVFLGSASAAFAYEDPENRIGDRYPFLEPTAAATALKIAQNRMVVRQTSGAIQLAYEDPENQIGDRYPFLDPMTRASRSMTAGRYLVARYSSSLRQDSARIEDPENKIADKYPFLEERTVLRRVAGRVVSRRDLTTGSIR